MIRMIFIGLISMLFFSCSQRNLLTYKNKKYYKEYSIISSDTVFELEQSICYNRPWTVDEDFCYCLTLTFLDTAEARRRKLINLAIDTLVVNSSYGRYSVWNWDDEHNKVTGQIEIIDWDKNHITIKENIRGWDYINKQTKTFIGKRIYKRENN